MKITRKMQNLLKFNSLERKLDTQTPLGLKTIAKKPSDSGFHEKRNSSWMYFGWNKCLCFTLLVLFKPPLTSLKYSSFAGEFGFVLSNVHAWLRQQSSRQGSSFRKLQSIPFHSSFLVYLTLPANLDSFQTLDNIQRNLVGLQITQTRAL